MVAETTINVAKMPIVAKFEGVNQTGVSVMVLLVGVGLGCIGVFVGVFVGVSVGDGSVGVGV